MIWLFAVAVGSYLCGGIPFSYIAGKVTRGIDLREHGSGNLGASNTFRILGAGVAIPVLIMDIAKGYVPVVVALSLAKQAGVADHWLGVTAMFASILGHLYSPYLKFSGGKGIATSAGAFFGLAPWAALGALLLFLLVFAARKIVSLASLTASISLPIFVYVAGRTGHADSHWSLLAVSIIIMGVVVLKHRSNIKRLLSGTEGRLARKKG